MSFVAGVVAGGVTGVLAAVLHSQETTADLQEKVRHVTEEFGKLKEALGSGSAHGVDAQGKLEIEGLQEDLDEIREDIRRMYKAGRS